MHPEGPVLFLSLRPQFAELLLSGRKTVELRRVRPSMAADGAKVLLYASSPQMTLVGQAEIKGVSSGPPQSIWAEFGPETGIGRLQFDDYFSGAEQAIAISLVNIRRLDKPRSLNDLRRRLTGFRPPQSYRYLSERQVAALI